MALLDFFPEWILTHGIAAIVVIPLFMAAITALIPNARISWAVVMTVTGICSLIAIALLLQVLADGSVHYDMGDWPAPIGISYMVNAINAPIILLLTLVGFICTLYALKSVEAEVAPNKRSPFYAAFLVSFAGLLGIVISADAFNIFVFLEISSISTYALIAMGSSRDRRALTSSFNYLMMGSIGATFFVIGVGFLYMQTGTLNLADIARVLQEQGQGSRLVPLSFAFIIIGLGLKLAMFPLHSWLPGAYAYGPSFFSAFLAATATKAAVYLMLRFTFTVFDPSWDFIAHAIMYVLAGLGILGMLFASLQAVFQIDIRRVLAFSSVAQIGYILLGIGMASYLGVQAGYLHILNHGVTKAALFLAVGAFWYRFGITKISDMRGLGKTMPLTMAGFTAAGLSLIGVPGTVGFVSKLALARAAAENGWWWAIGVIMVSSILALIYIGRMIEQAYFKPPHTQGGKELAKNEAPLSMLIPLWVLVVAAWYFGLDADWTTYLSGEAAELLEKGPIVLPDEMIPEITSNKGGY